MKDGVRSCTRFTQHREAAPTPIAHVATSPTKNHGHFTGPPCTCSTDTQNPISRCGRRAPHTGPPRRTPAPSPSIQRPRCALPPLPRIAIRGAAPPANQEAELPSSRIAPSPAYKLGRPRSLRIYPFTALRFRSTHSCTKMPALAKPASRPAKTAAAPKPKPAAGASHPPYFEMIKEAITALKERTGSSSHAIAKYMEDKHGASLPANYKKMLSIQLRGFAAKGKLVKVKASYKLSDAAKKDSPKPAAAKTAAPKPSKAAAKPKKSTTTVGKPKKTAAAAAGTKRKAPEKKIVAKPKKSPAAKAKAKPKTVKSPASKKARKWQGGGEVIGWLLGYKPGFTIAAAERIKAAFGGRRVIFDLSQPGVHGTDLMMLGRDICVWFIIPPGDEVVCPQKPRTPCYHVASVPPTADLATLDGRAIQNFLALAWFAAPATTLRWAPPGPRNPKETLAVISPFLVVLAVVSGEMGSSDPLSRLFLPCLVPPPLPSSDGRLSPSSVLLDCTAYICADAVSNATTAVASMSTGTPIHVSFCLASPPRLSYLCVHFPGPAAGTPPAPPPSGATHADVALISVPIPGARHLCDDFDYFVYTARPQPGASSLDLLPKPTSGFRDADAAILRCQSSAGHHRYVIACLRTTIDSDELFRFHLYDSNTRNWSTPRLLRLENPAERDDVLPIPDTASEVLFHETTKTIILGGPNGTVGWVDLWRGILFCDVLDEMPVLRDMPLPKPSRRNRRDFCFGGPHSYRDISVVAATSGQEHGINNNKVVIKYVEMETRPGEIPLSSSTKQWLHDHSGRGSRLFEADASWNGFDDACALRGVPLEEDPPVSGDELVCPYKPRTPTADLATLDGRTIQIFGALGGLLVEPGTPSKGQGLAVISFALCAMHKQAAVAPRCNTPSPKATPLRPSVGAARWVSHTGCPVTEPRKLVARADLGSGWTKGNMTCSGAEQSDRAEAESAVLRTRPSRCPSGSGDAQDLCASDELEEEENPEVEEEQKQRDWR
ncbi:hypothetical protein HU200_063173 [Digitaria exilis]|uniref:Histone H1 n=1 Tax=Digitaria exilis TaxID=1010633 RepID=A0A835DWH2_9POAL|nr:hypothetical protein HU200_063173 [Digitaria exilis]